MRQPSNPHSPPSTPLRPVQPADACAGRAVDVTTLHCTNSAIVKLGRLAKPQTVYRGISGRVLPGQVSSRELP